MNKHLALALAAIHLVSGCATFMHAAALPAAPRLEDPARHAIAADAVKLLLQRASPARTTLIWYPRGDPERSLAAAFEAELIRQLRVQGFAIWEPPEVEVRSAAALPANAFTAILQPLPGADDVYCAVIRVAESQWARCYRLATDRPVPAGGWSRISLAVAAS